jgi:predicted  nucleic acid-binding Zn-ribbon protein
MDGLNEKLDDSKLEADKLKNQVSQLEQENDAISSENKSNLLLHILK